MKIVVYPKDSNPYQALLYSSMLELDPSLTITYVDRYPYIGATLFPFVVLFRKLQGYELVHIHWPTFTITFPLLPFRKQLSSWLFKLCIIWMKLLNYKIIWTVHNVIPHEPQTKNDLESIRFLSKMVDLKIIHSSFTLEQMKRQNISTNNCLVIPIGPYKNIYLDNITKQAAREALSIGETEFVILFFGLVRSYKGIEDLISALIKLKLSNVRLIIAGKCTDRALAKLIRISSKIVKIDFYNYFIPNNDVAQFFQACDISCTPFREVTTSSSVLLAMAFSKPIIAPRVGALLDLPDNVGYLYDPKKPELLEKGIQEAFKKRNNLTKLGKNARKYSDSLSWGKIAKKTHNAYLQILS